MIPSSAFIPSRSRRFSLMYTTAKWGSAFVMSMVLEIRSHALMLWESFGASQVCSRSILFLVSLFPSPGFEMSVSHETWFITSGPKWASICCRVTWVSSTTSWRRAAASISGV